MIAFKLFWLHDFWSKSQALGENNKSGPAWKSSIALVLNLFFKIKTNDLCDKRIWTNGLMMTDWNAKWVQGTVISS